MMRGIPACLGAALLILAAVAGAADADGNRVDDALDAEIRRHRAIIANPDTPIEDKRSALAEQERRVRVEFLFKTEANPGQRITASRFGVEILHEYENIAHGWVGTAALNDLWRIAQLLGPNLVMVTPESAIETCFVDANGREQSWQSMDPVALDDFAAAIPEGAAGVFLRQEDGDAGLLQAKADRLWLHGLPAFPIFEEADKNRARLMLKLIAELRANGLLPERLEREAIEEYAVLAKENDMRLALDVAAKESGVPWEVELGADRPAAARRLTVKANEEQRLELLYNPLQLTLRAEAVAMSRELNVSAHAEETSRGMTLTMRGSRRGNAALVVEAVRGAGHVAVRELAFAPHHLRTPEPRDVPLVKPAPRGIQSNPVRTPPTIDGSASEYRETASVNNIKTSTRDLRLAAMRLAHDNDFLYVHLAATAPATADPPSGFWIIADTIDGAGDGILTNNKGNGPRAITEGMEGVVLERGIAADRIIFIENASTASARTYMAWMLDCNAAESTRLGEVIAGPPSIFTRADKAPIGAAVAFANRTLLGASAEGELTTGIELRLPLSALGIPAPLKPASAKRTIRLMAGCGRGDTGEWSNQVLGPVNLEGSIGGGIDGVPPDFERNRAFPSGKPVSFDGIQLVEYQIQYAPR